MKKAQTGAGGRAATACGRIAGSALGLLLMLTVGVRPAHGYIRQYYSLGRILAESPYVSVLRVTAVDRSKNVVTYQKVRDLKGTLPDTVLVHNIGRNGEFSAEGKANPGTFIQESARDWRDIMEWASAGKEVVMFCNGNQAELCMGNYWYQAWREGKGWRMIHSEPIFALAFAGRVQNLAAAVQAMQAGQEVVVSCMAPSDVRKLLDRTARLQRMKASLKITDHNVQRDFVAWGGDGEELRRLAGMPGFSQYGALPAMGTGRIGLAPSFFKDDGKPGLCLFSEQRVVLMESREGFLSERASGVEGGARAADWADYNGDGRPDLLLATPAGLRLFANTGSNLVETTSALPASPYPHFTAAVWIGSGKDARPDILAADGFRGLRLYRNRTLAAGSGSTAPRTGRWYYAGPFDNAGGNGFATAYPPEKEVNLAATYTGRDGAKVAWKEGSFTDGQVNDLALFQAPYNENTTVYLYREFETGAGSDIRVSLGSDDTLTVWFNGRQVHAENVARSCAPDQAILTLRTRPGRNTILLKVCQGGGGFAFYFSASPATSPSVVSTCFEDVSDGVGLGQNGAAGGLKGDALVVADVNGDGFDDVLFSAGSGVLLLQTPTGFAESPAGGIAYQTGVAVPAFGDFNGDGRPDLFAPQADGPSRLFVNEGAGRFRDVTATAGDLAKPLGAATCAVWDDFCKRGRADLLVGCVRGQNRYLRNNGDGTFTDAGGEIGLYEAIYNTTGIAVSDVNQDGVSDLVMGNSGGESAVLLGNQRRLFSGETVNDPSRRSHP